MRSSKVPSRRTGFCSVSPCSSPRRKSSSPKASAVCTTPVPSSVVTKSAGSTVWPFAPKSVTNENGGSYARPTSVEPGTGSEVWTPSPNTRSASAWATISCSPSCGHAHVRDVLAHGQRGVGQQRPRRGGPAHQRDARLVMQREAHEGAQIDHVLVAQRDLVRRQRRAAARAVGHDLVALVQQPLVPHLLERPPDRLDVVVVQRVVGVVGVDPEADPLRQLVPLVDVLQHRLAALGVELGHAVRLDVVLGLEAQFLLDLQLDR